MSGESLADLLLRVGVDSSDIVQGFANANRKAAQAGREMAETVNNALSRIEFTALGVNAQDAVRTATNTMLKEAIAARTIIERSASNVMIAGMTGVGGKTDSGAMISRLNAFAVAQRQKAESDMDVMKRYEVETERRMEAVRQRQRAQLAESQREQQSALDQRIRLENEARNSQLEGERGAEEDRRKLFSQGLRERLQREADVAAALEADTERRHQYSIEERRQELRMMFMIQNQQGKINEEMAFENQLAKERVEFEEQLARMGYHRPSMALIHEARMKEFDTAQTARRAARRAAIDDADAADAAEEQQRRAREAENIAVKRLELQRLLQRQQEATNEKMAFENRLARERLEFQEQLRALGEDPRMTVVGNTKMSQFDEAQAARLAAFRTKEEIDVENQAERDRNRILKERENLQEEALRIVRATESAQDAHNRRLQRYEYLLKEGVLTQKQFNTAVQQSEVIMKSQRAGGGQMSGVLAQLSFGLEDFAQGIAMGDFRAAMLGASNNMSMVIRGLKDMDAAGRASFITLMKFPLIAGAFVGIGVAALAIAHHIKNANTELKTLADRISEATSEYYRFNQELQRDIRIRDFGDEVDQIKDMEALDAKHRQEEKRHADEMAAIKLRDQENEVKGREAILKMLGGEANMIELQRQLKFADTEDAKKALQNLSNAMQAAQEGRTQNAINEMRLLFNYLDQQSMEQMAAFNMLGIQAFLDSPALNELEKYFQQGSILNAFFGDDAEALKEIRSVLEGIAKDEKANSIEKEKAKAALADLDRREVEIAAERAKQEQELTDAASRRAQLRMEELRAQRSEELFLLRATDHEKELLRLKKEQAEFAGAPEMGLAGIPALPGAGFAGMAGLLGLAGQAAEQQMNNMAFLQAQRDNIQNEINQLLIDQVPKAQGALEQDAFKAQAAAFKQMMENANQKPNPQMTRMISLLQSIDTAIQNGGIIQGVP